MFPGECLASGTHGGWFRRVGKQGAGKTQGIKALAPIPDSYVEINLEHRDDNLARSLRGKLVGEIAELRGLQGREAEANKAWVSRTHEEWIPKYLEFGTKFPRRLLFIGTTNNEEFLADDTGERRWLPVRTGVVDIEGLRRDRDQLWAEAVVRFRQGELWYPTSQEDVVLFGEQQAEREHGDVYEALIDGKTGGMTEITMVEIFASILEIEPAKMTRAEQIRVGEAMKRLGWTKKRTGLGEGRSYVYERKIRGVAPGVGFSGAETVPF